MDGGGGESVAGGLRERGEKRADATEKSGIARNNFDASMWQPIGLTLATPRVRDE
jgi:hypothetical protein